MSGELLLSVNIRLAKIEDITAIQQIAKKSWAKTYENLLPVSVQKAYLNEYYSTEQLYHKLKITFFFVLETDNELVGFANLYRSERENDLSAIYLLPDFQQKGMGKALLKKVINQLQEGDELVVYVEKGNEQAEMFYKNNGFTFLEEFQETFFNHIFNTVKMSLKI